MKWSNEARILLPLALLGIFLGLMIASCEMRREAQVRRLLKRTEHPQIVAIERGGYPL